MKNKIMYMLTGGGGTAEQAISRTSRQSALTASPKASGWIPLSGFTMAEILLSLTIIGVVAAITLPSLTGNINERTWNTQRKALYARFSQAISLMPALNGYGTLTAATSSVDAVDTVAETFITAGLSKVLKINNICDSDHIQDCGLASRFTALNGSNIPMPTNMSSLNDKMLTRGSLYHNGTFSFLNSNAAAFETANGESILTFYNPSCVPDMNEAVDYYMQPKVCVNFIYDLNGSKGPNTVGKDIGFITVLYPTDSSVVMPVVPVQKASSSADRDTAISVCKEQDSEFRIPNLDELASMFVNQKLIWGELTSDAAYYWSATLFDSTRGWTQGFNSGARLFVDRTEEHNVHCVKR